MARALTGRTSDSRAIDPRRPVLTPLTCPDTEQLIDHGLVILFKGPKSFTGEDVAEFHTHGSLAVEAALYDALSRLGAHPAEPGAFTRRAFENGKLDLAQVEALADLIDAETAMQRQQALGQLDGRLSRLAQGWRTRLLAVLAPLEAGVDFPDEADVPEAIAASAGPAIEKLIDELSYFLRGADAAQTVREGFRIAILGQPNAGKSSLLNFLAGNDLAIVSEIPGTTRDVIEVRLDLAGVAVSLADTAGLRAAPADAVEEEGMRRALKRAEDAHLRILVIDPLTEDIPAGGVSRETLLRALRSGHPAAGALIDGDLIVINKTDLSASLPAALTPGLAGEGVFGLSAKTGAGMDVFVRALTDCVGARAALGENTVLTRARHVAAIKTAIASLQRARDVAPKAPELAAEDARLAARALSAITGEVDVEDVLGEIFSSFCIGK